MTAIFEQPLYPFTGLPPEANRAIKVAVTGAGPIGLACAIDLAQHGIPVVILDDNDRVSTGSRAICFAQRTLEIFERLGCGQRMLDKGVTWQRGRVFNDTREVFSFDLQPEGGHRFPAFINLQQYYVEQFLVERLRELEADGAPVEIRGRNRVAALAQQADTVSLDVETPDGSYALRADWVIACDGANSPTRNALGLGFDGRVFEDNFLIADVKMAAGFPTERWFWFDPPFNRGQSALLHKQPDDIWRIDLQLGPGVDKEVEKQPEQVIPRIKAMLGEDVEFDLEWVSVYTFQCRRMRQFRHGRVLFAGDSAHQVSPFGARGANGGVQDADNLCWKLAAVVRGEADEKLIDSYDTERVAAADENILNSTRSTDFLTPKSDASRTFRDAVLALAGTAPFARPLVNSGRLSRPSIYGGAIDDGLPDETRPGAPAPDAPSADGWLLDRLGNQWSVLVFGDEALEGDLSSEVVRITLPRDDGVAADRYVGAAASAVYLVRPDQHVAARWVVTPGRAVAEALTATLAPGRVAATAGAAALPEATTEKSLQDPDTFYEALLCLHEGLSDEDSAALNARLVLALANRIDDSAALREAFAIASQARPTPD